MAIKCIRRLSKKLLDVGRQGTFMACEKSKETRCAKIRGNVSYEASVTDSGECLSDSQRADQVHHMNR
jgi:hypothetical protein